MVFKVKPKAAPAAALIKDGTYRATVSNLKQFANTYGERIGFEFTIRKFGYGTITVSIATVVNLNW